MKITPLVTVPFTTEAEYQLIYNLDPSVEHTSAKGS